MSLALCTDSYDLVLCVVNVVGNELVRHDVSCDVSRSRSVTAAAILDALVVVASPEEGDRAIRYQLAHHVEGCVSTLVKGHIPMLCPHSLAIDPVGIAGDVARCKNVLIGGLQERVALNASIRQHLDARSAQKLRIRSDTCAQDNKISIDLFTRGELYSPCLAVCITQDLCNLLFG